MNCCDEPSNISNILILFSNVLFDVVSCMTEIAYIWS